MNEAVIPDWIRKKRPDPGSLASMKSLLRDHRLHTVCEEAKCPNIGECFGLGTATFLIMGDTCTRNCSFCGVSHGEPAELDREEPERIARAARHLGLAHVVITSVTRDDLPDGGASHFGETILCLRRELPGSTVEVLVPDFRGDTDALDTVLSRGPDVLNHNMETVPRLYPQVRHGASYHSSLALLSHARSSCPDLVTKSGLMVGLGETIQDVKDVMIDMRTCDVSVVTIGQYLRPPGKNLKVKSYYTPDQFSELREFGSRLGFRHVGSGPFVRSSFHAAESIQVARGEG